MAKMKIHELAKELGVDNNVIVNFLQSKGSEVKSYRNNIEEKEIDLVRGKFKGSVSSNEPKSIDNGKASRVEKPEKNNSVTAKADQTPSEPVVHKQRPMTAQGERKNMSEQNVTTGSTESEDNIQSVGDRKYQHTDRRPQGNNGEGPQTSTNSGDRRPQGQGSYGDRRPQGQNSGDRRPYNGDRPQGQNSGDRRPYNGDRPQGQNSGDRRPYNGDRPQGQGNYGDRRPQGQNSGDRRPYNGDRPQGQGNYGDRRPQGQGSYGDRRPNSGDRPQGQGNYGDRRPQGQGSYGDRRPQGQGSYGDRPQGQGSYGDRPQGQGSYGDRRPQGQGSYGDRRPQGQGSYGDRPQGQGSYGDRRPQGQGSYGDRPQGQGNYGDRRPGGQGSYGDRRPQGQGSYGDRPQGQGNFGDRRPQGQGGYGGRPQGQGSYGGRPQGQGGYAGRSQGQGSFGGFNKDFDKDKDSGYTRSFDKKRTDPKSGEKSSIKSDLANELTKEQRAAAFNDKSRDRDRNRDRGRNNVEDGNIKSAKGKKDPNRKGAFIMPKPQQSLEKQDEIKTVIIPEVLTIKELADKMKVVPSVVVKKLFLAGKMVSINSEITFEEAEEIALGYEIIAEKEVLVNKVEELLKEDDEDENLMVKRPPVVCVMGHVDHGKTSLLDAIREANVTSREAGGITQHIGAYTVEVNGEKITFLDTPGHEAFTSMRMRGAKSTDIAILVVAADDGVMPQTVEAISHAKAAGVQIIVAINKIDKPSANIERVKQELTEHELIAEDWGGDTIFVPVSAHTKEGIDQLLEMIILTAEMGELKANPDRMARGIVIEAELDKGRGTVATILVQKGTLHVGDNIVIGSTYGKVRAMMDDKGRRVKEATPSTPVEILGLNAVPNAGEIFMATENEKEARNIADAFISQGKERLLADTKAKLSLDGLFSQIQAGNIKELNLIVKADVQGSVEAVKQSLVKLSNEEVAVRIIHGGVGAINESDVMLASTSNAIIIGFNVRPDNMAREIAEREKVDLRLYRVIYSAIEDVEAAMKGMLDPTFEEKVMGHAEVRQVFKASGLGTIAGSYVLDGKIVRGCSARITREGTQIFEGALASLKRFKDDVKEVNTGYECGLVFEKFNDIQEYDLVELYMMVEVPR
ncbi:translation initiation factor IF-2 [Lachnoclostridium phytofermentans]|uniref:Translation initiation factor IF-2 n=1 Tax=Lachnoclostridium phytofermentans (strain ATCC 700394 / DSM 18823 / ISDg) TaxID=357809 RepID=IF2_LACP7|nr:translation initiation factor IF-2 [Lachnoclostridium phytofermentans]A9KNW4.1 RecName: Full=Translation initiation factor IF-2 [Lachnoclostridium phytofermentans ISDg]ABX43134.1 translation initiation factor IF-2 [Lachnoclostridium phytofermentans ISDg]